MPAIQLLFFPGCPHVPAARSQLRRALELSGHATTWEELDVTAPATPEHLRAYGSPTILVDGRDVTGAGPGTEALACRLYADSDLPGAPPLSVILAALR
jgi:hypothetical protein